MTQLPLPIHIAPPQYPVRIVTVHLPSNEGDPTLTLCDEACTRFDPVSDNPDECGCMECLLIYERNES